MITPNYVIFSTYQVCRVRVSVRVVTVLHSKQTLAVDGEIVKD